MKKQTENLETRLSAVENKITDIKDSLESIANVLTSLLPVPEEPKKIVAKILPRMSNNDLSNNENLLTSSFYRLLTLTDALTEPLHIDEVITEDSNKDYDIIISRFMGDDINTINRDKPIYEFMYCGLNGGWFFERYTNGLATFNTSYEKENENGVSCIHVKDQEEIKSITGLSNYFFGTEVKLNAD